MGPVRLGKTWSHAILFFAGDPSLRNIITGVVTDYVDEYCTFGQKSIDKLIGQPVFSYSFKRKDKAKTLGDASVVKVTPELSIDPALLSQRLIVVSGTRDLSLEDVLKYESNPFL